MRSDLAQELRRVSHQIAELTDIPSGRPVAQEQQAPTQAEAQDELPAEPVDQYQPDEETVATEQIALSDQQALDQQMSREQQAPPAQVQHFDLSPAPHATVASNGVHHEDPVSFESYPSADTPVSFDSFGGLDNERLAQEFFNHTDGLMEQAEFASFDDIIPPEDSPADRGHSADDTPPPDHFASDHEPVGSAHDPVASDHDPVGSAHDPVGSAHDPVASDPAPADPYASDHSPADPYAAEEEFIPENYDPPQEPSPYADNQPLTFSEPEAATPEMTAPDQTFALDGPPPSDLDPVDPRTTADRFADLPGQQQELEAPTSAEHAYPPEGQDTPFGDERFATATTQFPAGLPEFRSSGRFHEALADLGPQGDAEHNDGRPAGHDDGYPDHGEPPPEYAPPSHRLENQEPEIEAPFGSAPIPPGGHDSEMEAPFGNAPIPPGGHDPDLVGSFAAGDQPVQPPVRPRPKTTITPGGGGRGNSPGSGLGRGSDHDDEEKSLRPSGMILSVVAVSLVLLAGLLWFGRSDTPEGTAAQAGDPAAPTSVASDAEIEVPLSNVRAVLSGLGLSAVVVENRDGVIHLTGPVPSQNEYDAAVNAANAVSGGFPVDTAALTVSADASTETATGPAPPSETGRPEALQQELDRLLAGTPLIFASGQAGLSELHQRILNNVVLSLQAYPGFNVTIVGYTDELGDDASNEGLSSARAENVRQYLLGQGLADNFDVAARGETGATGSAGLAGLERRVEFEVNTGAAPATEAEALRIAVVAPSAANDLAFTQSMVDAVNLLGTETPVELAVTDNTFVPDEAAAAVRGYAEQGYDLVIAHGSQFGASLLEIAPQFPETAFAWGTASDTFGLPNVYAYDAAAQQGGYVMGAMAALISANDVIGVVGPIEVGDAALYVNGFQAGARAQAPQANLLVSYTGSFSDTALAAEAANNHLGAGADVLTGSAQMVVGAVSATEQAGAVWFGTQSDQASLAPASVVASQVYRWEVALRPIVADIRAGRLAGTTYTADLANGGLTIEFNPGYPLAPEVRQRADQLIAEIANGAVVPPG